MHKTNFRKRFVKKVYVGKNNCSLSTLFLLGRRGKVTLPDFSSNNFYGTFFKLCCSADLLFSDDCREDETN